MLTTSQLGRGQENYYLESVGQAREDYYTERGEAPGLWIGRGCQELGLEDRVEGEALTRILEGRHPETGEQLSRHGIEVPGWDATVAAPKSVSMMRFVGHEVEWQGRTVGQLWQEAHDQSAASMLRFLESQVAYASRGHAREFSIETTGLIVAGFGHRTAREEKDVDRGGLPDMHLHTHFLIANQVRGVDGRWSALDGRRLHTRVRKTAGMLYQCELRWRGTAALGVRWGEVTRHGQADLAKVTGEMVAEYSKRRAQIVGNLEERARELNAERRAMGMPEAKLDTVEAFEVARRQTRAAKNRQMETGQLVEGWQRGFEERFGQDPEEFVRSLLGEVKQAPALNDEQRETLYREVAERLTAEAATFDRLDVIQAMACALTAGLPAEQVVAEADRFLESEHVLPVANRADHEVIQLRDGRTVAVPGDERCWTTPETVKTEREMVRIAQQRQSCQLAQVPVEDVERAIGKAKVPLNEEQAEMVRRLTTSGHGVEMVNAGPGSGKTTALGVAVEAWRRAGIEVFGTAITSKARNELRDAGLGGQFSYSMLRKDGTPFELVVDRTRTAAQLLIDLEQRDLRLPRGSVLVGDEASMLDTPTLKRLMELGRRDDVKIVFSGDPEQLPAIGSGGGFAGLCARFGAIELKENHRQVEDWEKQAVVDFREGRIEDAQRAYEERGMITFDLEGEELLQDMVDHYFGARDRGEDALMIAFKNADVDALNATAREVRVRRGEIDAKGVQTSRYTIGKGDDIVTREGGRPWANGVPREIINGTRARVHGTHPDGSLDIETEEGRRVVLPAEYVREKVDLGYARSAYTSQSATVDRTFNLVSAEDASKEVGLVQQSRERYPGHIWWRGPRSPEEAHGPEPEQRRPPADQMAAAWSRSRRQVMAIDQMDPAPRPTASRTATAEHRPPVDAYDRSAQISQEGPSLGL
jgi:conjugative relaxase-like TrwC/TraI family protein